MNTKSLLAAQRVEAFVRRLGATQWAWLDDPILDLTSLRHMHVTDRSPLG